MWPYLLLWHRFGAHMGAILRGGAHQLPWIWLELRETWGAGHLWASWLWWPYGSEGLPGRECHQLDIRDWRMFRGDRSSDPFRAKTWIYSFPNGAASIFGCIRCSCQSGESRIRRFSPHLFTTRQTGISRAALRASALPRGIRCSSWSRQSRFRRFSPDLFPVRRITNSSQFCGQQLCRASDTMAACRNPHRPAGTLDGALRLRSKDLTCFEIDTASGFWTMLQPSWR